MKAFQVLSMYGGEHADVILGPYKWTLERVNIKNAHLSMTQGHFQFFTQLTEGVGADGVSTEGNYGCRWCWDSLVIQQDLET